MRLPIRTIRKYGLKLVAVLAGVLVITCLALATSPGQRVLVTFAARLASEPGMVVRIGGLTGSLFSSGRFEYVTVADARGTWLDLDSIAFEWRPTALLRGKLDILRLAIGRATLRRLPDVPQSPSSPPHWAASRPLIGLDLGTARIDEIVLIEDVLGVPVRLAASASVSMADLRRGLAGQLVVRRIDGPDGVLNASVAYHPVDRLLDVDISASEPAGGLAATLLQFPELPPLKAVLKGTGRFDNWHAALTISGNGTVFTRGEARLSQENNAYRFMGQLDGYLEHLVPRRARDLFVGRTEAKVTGMWSSSDQISIERASLATDSARMDLKGMTDLRRSFVHGEAKLSVGRADHAAVRLPFDRSSNVSVKAAQAVLVLSPETSNRPLKLVLGVEGMKVTTGQVERMNVRASAVQPVPYDRRWKIFEQIELWGSASGVEVGNAVTHQPVAAVASFNARGRANGTDVTIDTFSTESGAVRVSGGGAIRNGRLDGRFSGTISDLSQVSWLVGRPLAGKLALKGKGQWRIASDAATVMLDGTVDDLKIESAGLDPLLTGTSKVHAELRTGAAGNVTIADVAIDGSAFGARLKGRKGRNGISGEFHAHVGELQRLHPAMRGGLTAKGTLKGGGRNIEAELTLSGEAVYWRDKLVEQLTLQARAFGPLTSLMGTVSVATRHAGVVGNGGFRVSCADGKGLRLDAIDVRYGKNRLLGWLSLGADDGLDGDLGFDFSDLRAFSAIAAVPLSGQLSASLKATGARQGRIIVEASQLAIDNVTFGRVDAEANVSGVGIDPQGAGTIRLTDGKLNGLNVSDLTLTVERKVGPLSFQMAGKSGNVSLNADGTVSSRDRVIDLTLQHVGIAAPEASGKLSEPSHMLLQDRSVRFDRLRFAVGAGHLALSGRVGRSLEIAAQFSSLPAALADIVLPELGAGGTVSGRANLTGTAADPKIAYELDWKNATVRAAGEAGVPLLSLSAKGHASEGVVNTRARVIAPGGLDVAMTGAMRIGSAGPLDLRAAGQVPLVLLNPQMATRGTRLNGLMKGDVAISGNPRQPRMSGLLSLAGGEIRDPATGIQLTNVQLAARLTGTAMVLDKLEGTAPKGGRLTASGHVLLDTELGLPADIRVKGEAVNVNDGETLAGTVGADISIVGALAGIPVVAGTVTLGRFDFIIPEQLPRSITELGIEHHNLSTTERLRLGLDHAQSPAVPDLPIRLNLRLVSDGKIFVRGRGIDAQLGGDLRLTGDSIAPIANGDFRMERGRIAILGRRLEFNRGTIGFAGSFNPTLDFQATSQAEGAVITTTVSGRASNPILRFTSSPELPEDEVLARLLFNKSLAKLSPLQIAHLASEIDRLGGLTGGPGVLDQLRKAVGVDVLDVTTDTKGNAAISAASNIGDNVYVGAQQNATTNSSRVIVDLDLTKNIKARGEVGSDGSSKLGIGVEWNY